MKAAIYTNPETLKITEIPIPKIETGELLIKVKNVGICGSDIGIYKGMHPRAQAPLILGHEFSGIVADCHAHSSFIKGEKVTVNPLIYCNACESCMTGNKHICETLKLTGIDANGGLADYVKVAEEQVVPLPGKMTFEQGALVEPVAVGVHAVRKADLKLGDDVLVLGGGPIGVITALCAKINGAKNIYVTEISKERREFIEKIGFTAINPRENLEESFMHLNKRKADIVFEVAGVEKTISDAINLVKNAGKIIVVSVFKNPALVDLQQVNFREVSLIGTRVYSDMDFKIAVKLIDENHIFNHVITHQFELDEVQAGIDSMLHQSDSLKVMIQV
ncbi:zinc-dependent alcohol dehydrogenase [Oceanobacillus timonensis]|uniref:zinc-dependent alcohol dehydrogenase n=1 Tax=Oceanobacillus timonensis TaxID=1926285 RepID=UPI0009BB18C0|nr:alcohol dehydrogenase catalytic domain-containing protein [Oceanobacillus timonensis]